MRKKLLAAGVLSVCLAALIFDVPPRAAPVPEAPAAVRLLTNTGSGSAVHIGDGFLLTAAHVVVGRTTITVHPDGAPDRHADVLWTNKLYDLALVRADPAGVAAANVSCRTPMVGEEITTLGSPLGEEFLTSWGRVSGTVRKLGPWDRVVLADMVIAPGNSGGPVFDGRGDVVGIAVGVLSFQNGFASSLTGFSMVVPASAACTLLART